MSEQTYKIGEAAELLNLKSYVLRFWETEFPQLVPLRTEKGQRLYTEANLVLLRRIRHLLHDRGLTIEGARKILTGEGAHLQHAQLTGISGSSWINVHATPVDEKARMATEIIQEQGHQLDLFGQENPSHIEPANPSSMNHEPISIQQSSDDERIRDATNSRTEELLHFVVSELQEIQILLRTSKN